MARDNRIVNNGVRIGNVTLTDPDDVAAALTPERGAELVGLKVLDGDWTFTGTGTVTTAPTEPAAPTAKAPESPAPDALEALAAEISGTNKIKREKDEGAADFLRRVATERGDALADIDSQKKEFEKKLADAKK